jgi:hypothetical protein
MKKQVFTLLTMIALVALVGSAWGQGTKWDPYVTETYVYTVGTLTDGDTYSFTMMNDGEAPYDVDEDGNTDTPLTSGTDGFTWITTTHQTSGTVGAGSNSTTKANVEVQWDEPGTYRLWIDVVQASGADPSNCHNYRWLEITVTYTVDFFVSLYTESSGNPNYDLSTATTATANQELCASFYNEDFENGSATVGEGSTFVYFSVTRDPNVSYDNDWEFTPIVTTSATGTVNWTYGTDGIVFGSSLPTNGSTAVPVASGTDVIYIRCEIENQNAEHTVKLAIGTEGPNASNATDLTPDVEDSDSDDIALTITVTALPVIGDFE